MIRFDASFLKLSKRLKCPVSKKGFLGGFLSEKKVEKPKIELLEATSLYTVELCSPIKEKINQIKICAPNIVFKPCSPIEKIKCVPSLPMCAPTVPVCPPGIPEIPPRFCIPRIFCGPRGCVPWVAGPIDWGAMVELPAARINEIATKVEELTARVDAISKRVAIR